jgi:predicted ATPase
VAKNQILLKHFEFQESMGTRLIWDIRKIPMTSFNLVLGDNAQGKTRFLNILRFINNIHNNAVLQLSIGIETKIILTFDDSGEDIIYKLGVIARADGSSVQFQDEVSRSGRVIFSRKNNILYDEIAKKNIENFFIADNIPAILSLKKPQFPTFSKLVSFFERMLFLEANRFSAGNIEITKGAMVPSGSGANIGCVLDTWKTKSPEAFKEVMTEFQDSFSFILKDSVTTREILLPKQGIQVPQLFFKDKVNKDEVIQTNWSDGMLRTLCLYALPVTRFIQNDGLFKRPSLICVDEIENGLDFNTLSNVLSFYEGYSTLSQILIASHSPTVCNLVDPKNWLIAKRNGIVVELISPITVEPDINETRKKLLKDNWEFYKNHISKSKLYVVN